MAATSTYDLYRRLVAERPLKARRYQKSIVETLDRTNIHELERERLEEALRGLADGFAEHPVCTRCGHAIESDEAKATGLGSHCRSLVAS